MFSNLISRMVAALPLELQFALGDFIGWLWFDVFRIRRQVAVDNIRRAFPDWEKQRVYATARASVRNIGRSFIEFLRLPSATPEQYEGHFILEGTEHLDRALAKKKGVCALTLHLGNGDWATVGLQFAGYPLHIISKNMKWSPMNEFWFESRRRIGTEFIPDRGSSMQILKTLKRNGIVVFVLDQFMGPPIGVKTRFFGHETGTAMGLAVIAGRSQSPVVPIYTCRLDDGRTLIRILEEIPFVEGDDSDETISNMTQKYSDVIESVIRQNPDQWMWVHRRWKLFKK